MGISKIPLFAQLTDEFTSSGSWVAPAGVSSAEILCVGAGGGGGGTDASVNTNNSSGGGGGGGAVKKITVAVTPGTTYTVTIGAKGTGGTATAGTNGGYSEVTNGATVLIRSWGGGGGAGINATDNVVRATIVGTRATGGGDAQGGANAITCAGGGNGAFAIFGTSSTTVYGSTSWGILGFGKTINTTTQSRIVSNGNEGIDGYGGGGGGAVIANAAIVDEVRRGAYGAGDGAGVNSGTPGATNGSSATRSGCGGGGAATALSTDAATGGDGADGFVRITYYA